MAVKIKLPSFFGPMLDKIFSAAIVKPGQIIKPPSELQVKSRTLLYFKSEACVGCEQLDMFIGRLASASGIDLRVIDARRGDLPENIYGDQLLLDKSGKLRAVYGIKMFPTLIVTNETGMIESAVAGGTTDENSIRERLSL